MQQLRGARCGSATAARGNYADVRSFGYYSSHWRKPESAVDGFMLVIEKSQAVHFYMEVFVGINE